MKPIEIKPIEIHSAFELKITLGTERYRKEIYKILPLILSAPEDSTLSILIDPKDYSVSISLLKEEDYNFLRVTTDIPRHYRLIKEDWRI